MVPPRTLAVLLLATLLCGCGRAIVPLTVTPLAAPTLAAPALAVRTAPSLAPTPAPVPSPQGQLAVRFGGLGALRSANGEDAIRITLTGAALATPVVEEATATQIVAAQGEMLLQGLPNGALSVQLQALDARGGVIGEVTMPARVTVGQTTVVAATLAPRS